MEMFDDLQIQRIWNAMKDEGFNPKNWYVYESPVETGYIIHNVANTVNFMVYADAKKPLEIEYSGILKNGSIMPHIAKSFHEAVELSGIEEVSR